MRTKNILIGAIIVIITIIISVFGDILIKNSQLISQMTAEDKRAMTYGELTEQDKKIEGTDYVQFSAFFTRDLNKDGYAEKIKGTCKEISETDDLYVELNVLTKGYLKDAKIILNAQNFKWTTSIVQDNIIKGNYIGETSEILLQDRVMNGTQKLVWGNIKANLANNINNYSSKLNSITLTGTHVIENDDGTTTQTPINKTINLTVDWYGTNSTRVYAGEVKKDKEELVNANNTVVNFDFSIRENNEKLLLQKQVAELKIPEFNNYAPTSVEVTNTGVSGTYDQNEKIFTITREATVDESGKITSAVSRYNSYNVRITYPLDAYKNLAEESIKISIPITGYNYGYNNPNEEFSNPYISSNNATAIVVYGKKVVSGEIWNLHTYVGDYIYNRNAGYDRYEISKELPRRIYNGNDKNEKDQYLVKWRVDIGVSDVINRISLEETDKKTETFNGNQSMHDYIKTTGIYFDGASSTLGRNGWIKLYDAEIEDKEEALIATFTYNDLEKYKNKNPYIVDLKSIKIETSAPISNSNMYIYQIKEIDDELLTSNYTEEEFNNLDYITTYLKGTMIDKDGKENSLTRTEIAYYDDTYSVQELNVSPSKISNQEKASVKFEIDAIKSQILDAKWKNGIFLLELPEEILKLDVNNITVSNENVEISDYYVYRENEKYYIKIYTESEEEDGFKITINADVTGNPLLNTKETKVKLYAYNENCDNYENGEKDIYEIDDDGLNTDNVGFSERTLTISSMSSAGILTAEYVTDYDDKNSMTIAPNIADIEKSDNSKTAKINISITNNYTGTLSEISILGKTPSEGNTYIINKEDMGSKFTANMTGAISIPEDMKEYVTVYYSEKENTNKDLDDQSNGWKLATEVTDWNKIKSYIIDLGNYVLKNSENRIFNYEISVPGGIGYNMAAFSDHAVYYCLDTVNGKLEVSTEPNKVGIQVVGKYNFELIKTRKDKENIPVSGAIFSLENLDANGELVTQVAKTDENGKLSFEKIYIDKEYTLSEIKAPENYEILKEKIKFKLQMNGNNAEFKVLEGTFKQTPELIADSNGEYIVKTRLSDEPRYILQITKTKINDNSLFVKNATYKVETTDNENNIISTTARTNENGVALIKELSLNKEYKLKETYVNNSYVVSDDEIKFIGSLDSTGNLKIEVTSETKFKDTPIIQTTENGTDLVKVNLEDEAKYKLIIKKTGENGKLLDGVKFSITNDGKGEILKTNENGIAEADNLEVNVEYELKETNATGYYLFEGSKKFKVIRDNTGKLVMQSNDSEFANVNIIETKGEIKAIANVELANEKIPTYTLDILKVEKNSKEKDISKLIKLENAKFKVYSNDTDEEKIYTTNADGMIEITDLYQYVEGKAITGKYIIKEIEAPNGYTNDAEEINLIVSRKNDGTIEANVENRDELETFKDVIVDGNKVTLVVEDKPLFKLTKVDSQTGSVLANAEFIIFELDQDGKEIDYGKDVNGNYVGTKNEYGDYVVKTDENGTVLLPLKSGTYKAVEVTYPEGYQELATEEFFKIEGKDEEIEDDDKNEVNIDQTGLSVLEISSIDDLVELSESVNSGNKYKNYVVKLTKDLDFESDNSYEDISLKSQLIKSSGGSGFTPIGLNYENEFEGILDGQNHKIENLYIKSSNSRIGFIANGQNAQILNLKLTGEIECEEFENSENGNYIGSIIAYLVNDHYNPKDLNIINCTSEVNINYSGNKNSYIGGIVGYISSSNEKANVINCKNSGKITGNSHIGGIVGKNYTIQNTFEIMNCCNIGDITSNNGSIGGIICYGLNANISTCYNEGKIINNGNLYTGGIVGENNGNIKIDKCYNKGEIVANICGGIAGKGEGNTSDSEKVISNCYNVGKISKDVNSTRISEFYQGGIGGSVREFTIINCYNAGEITNLDFDGYIGGIAGDIRNSIQNCHNIATIRVECLKADALGSKHNVGGIAGSDEYVDIKNCYNTGNIYGRINRPELKIAGIAAGARNITECHNTGEIKVNSTGYCYVSGIATQANVEKCYNTGDIIGYVESYTYPTVYIGGILSRFGSANNCYNTGDIKGYCYDDNYSYIYAGGIGGCDCNISNSYNVGNVSASGNADYVVNNVGGIIGTDKNVTNCYYSDNILLSGNNIIKKGNMLSNEYMKTPDFYNELNVDDVWIYRNGRYPVLEKSVPEDLVNSTEIEINNTIKEYKITTEVENRIGGSISGGNEAIYENVLYNSSNSKEIVMTPESGYIITKVTINGEEHVFNLENETDSYTIPVAYFKNMKEDKHIIVTYKTSDQLLTIEKVDESNNTKKLEGAKFVIKNYFDEWTEGKLGKIVDNGATCTVADTDNELKNVVGNIQNNNNTYIFEEVEEDGKTVYKSNNDGVKNSTAYSYIPIDLTNYEGTYQIVVSGKFETTGGTGYVTINNSTEDVESSTTEGRIINISGRVSTSKIETEYAYKIDGNQKYYLHLGHKKSLYEDYQDDKFVVSGIKIYKTKQANYSFKEEDGKYVSTNTGVYDSDSNSYIPIDLTNVTGNYKVTVNAEILSESGSGDYGYAIITENTDAPEYTASGKFIFIYGNTVAEDYSKTIPGGKMYYLHFGYHKDNANNLGEDIVKINNVKLSLEKEDNIYEEVTTNEEGIAKVAIPNNEKLYIIETRAPEGYTLDTNTKEYNMVLGENNKIQITNKKQTGLTVHHYLKGTTNKVAEDEEYISDIGAKYTTAPHIDLEGLELTKDLNGNYQIPLNASGTYTEDAIEVIYYYEAKPIMLTINHYIEGTEKTLVTTEYKYTNPKVIFDENGKYKIEMQDNYDLDKNANYNNLLNSYSLTSITSSIKEETNIEDTLTYTTDSEITYYYNLKEYTITTKVEPHIENRTNEQTNQKEEKEVDGGTISLENGATIEKVKSGKNSTQRIIVTPNNNYTVEKIILISTNESTEKTTVEIYGENKDNNPEITYVENNDGSITINTFENVIENKEVIVKFAPIVGKVIVHYYYENTGEEYGKEAIKVDLKDGNKAENLEISDLVDEPYIVGRRTDISDNYSLTSVSGNTTGKHINGIINIYYYYKLKDTNVNVKYLEKDSNEVLAEEVSIFGKVNEQYTTEKKTITGYTYIEDTNNTQGVMTVEPIEVIYYYLKNTKAKVQYIDKTTGKIIEENSQEGVVGDIFETVAKDFENYVLVEEPEEKVITMQKDEIVLKYYYIHVSGGVIEKHIDLITNEILDNQEYTGNEGDDYKIDSKEFEGYDLVEEKLPTNAEGKMTKDPIEVKYYYIKKAKVITKYIDKITGKEIHNEIIQNGHENDKYVTDNKVFEGYKLVEVPKNASGTMEIKTVINEDGTQTIKDTIEVIYYYIHNSAGVIERHIDLETNELLEKETKYEGYEGDEYKTEEKQFKGYDIVKEKLPTNANGRMTKEEIVVNYYYRYKTEVITKYVDKISGKEIEKAETIEGHEGDEYKTKEKEIEGYDIIKEELPTNSEGKMAKKTIEVIYYYVRPAEVEIKYIDKTTGKEIDTKENILGHENDEYKTEKKDIMYYKFVEATTNTEGKMKVQVLKLEDGTERVNNKIEVKYYYRPLTFNLKVDKTVSKVILNGESKEIVDNNLAKVEIHRKELESTSLKVEYTIKVSNTGELAGSATLLERIPEGFIMKAEDNKDWTMENGLAQIEIDGLEVGEEKEYKVVLQWKQGEKYTGTKENIASIINIKNAAEIKEETEKDNEDGATMIIVVATGVNKDLTILTILTAIIGVIGLAVYVTISKKEK